MKFKTKLKPVDIFLFVAQKQGRYWSKFGTDIEIANTWWLINIPAKLLLNQKQYRLPAGFEIKHISFFHIKLKFVLRELWSRRKKLKGIPRRAYRR